MSFAAGRNLLPAAVALFLSVPGPALAFVRTRVPNDGPCLYWDQRQLPWSLQVDASKSLGFDATRAAVRKSFQTWQDVDCTDLSFVEGPTTEARVAGYAAEDPKNNTNVLLFREQLCDDVVPDGDPCFTEGGCGNTYDCWEFQDGVIALTTTTFEESSGRIVDADVEFNEANFFFTDVDSPPCSSDRQRPSCVATDLQNTATHEIGHLLGLDHSPVKNATMFASAPLGETSKRTLASDDLDGICSIYPLGSSATQCDGTDVHDGGCGCDAAGPEGIGLLGLGVLGLRLLRRR